MTTLRSEDMVPLRCQKKHEQVANCDRRRLFIGFQDHIGR